MTDVSQEHIAVAVRMRPMNMRETEQGDRCCWKCNPDHNCIHQIDTTGSAIPNSIYTYDCVFGPESTTETVYLGLGKRIVDSFVKGINGTIFAYGQTSSGKTYTMHGDDASPGLLYLASKDIFDYMARTPEREFILRGSYVELYKEEVKDLLDPSTPTLRIRENYERGVYVESKEEVIHNYQDLMNLLRIGDKHRHIGVTNMNQQSSRSHTIFKLICESRLREEYFSSTNDPGGVLVGQLSLVDLAGSESVKYTGATGETLDEARKINLSLSVLSRVISALASKTESGHVSYRDSKLTRILQSSLDGNSRTAIIACVTPASTFTTETISTLKFAQRAKNIHTSARVNELLDDKAVIRKLKRELEAVKKQLQEKTEGSGMLIESSTVPDVSLLEKDRELNVIQSKLNDMTRDMRDKDILLQQRSTEKSSIEAELVLLQARERDLQNKLTEVITHLEDLKAQYEVEKSGRENYQSQYLETKSLLHLAQDELENIKKRDLDWWIESKRLSQEAANESTMDVNEVKNRIFEEINSLRREKNELDMKIHQQEEQNGRIQEQLHQMEEEKQATLTENENLTNQIVKLVPEVNRLKKANQDLKTEIEGLETERDRILIEKDAVLSSLEEMNELKERVNQMKMQIEENKRLGANYENERVELKLQLKESQEKSALLAKELKECTDEKEGLKADLDRMRMDSALVIEEADRFREEQQQLLSSQQALKDNLIHLKEEMESQLKVHDEELQMTIKENERQQQLYLKLLQEKEAQDLQIKQMQYTWDQIAHEKEELVQHIEQLQKDRVVKQELVQENAKLVEQMKQLEQEREEIQQVCTRLNDTMEKLQENVTTLVKESQTSDEVIEGLKQAKSASDKKCVQMEDQLKQLQDRICEKEKEVYSSKEYVEQLRLQLRALEVVIQSNDTEIDELKACVVVSDDDVDRLKQLLIQQRKKQLQERNDLNNQLQSELDIYRQEVIRYTQEEMLMVNMREENKQMKNEIIELKERLELEQNECEARIREMEVRIASPIQIRQTTMLESQEKSQLVQELEEAKASLTKELKESEEKVAMLKQTIRSKYAEYKQMTNYVSETKETNTLLLNDVELLKRKYKAAKLRIASLEKSKLSTEDMEKIRQLLVTKEARDRENTQLRKEMEMMRDSINEISDEKKRLSNQLSASLTEIEEKEARINELENDLKEARSSSVGLYGSSKDYLENENLKMSIRIEDLEETIKSLRAQLKDKKGGTHMNVASPSLSRKNRRREVANEKLQSPSKQTHLSEYDLDDVSKCNPQ